MENYVKVFRRKGNESFFILSERFQKKGSDKNSIIYITQKTDLNLYSRPIKLVNFFTPSKLKANTRTLKLRLIQIELLKKLNFDHNSKLHIVFDSVKADCSFGSHFIESLKTNNFNSSLLTKKDYLQHYNNYKSLKDGFKSTLCQFDVSSLKFKNGSKVLMFPQRDDLNRLIELEIRRIVDNNIQLELKVVVNKEEVNLRGE